MTFKHAILASMDRTALSILARKFQVPQVDDQQRELADEELCAALDRCEGLTLAALMSYLHKNALVEICRVVGVPHKGTRHELEQRLMEFQQGFDEKRNEEVE